MHHTGMVVIVQFAWDIIFEEDEHENNEVIEKIDNYAEKIIPLFNDKQFKTHFRMSPSTFEDLYQKLKSVSTMQMGPGHPSIPLEKATMIMLWYLSNIESFRSVSERFGITKSSCWLALYHVCELLLKVNKKFHIISWPTAERQTEIMNEFKKVAGVPNVIGAIDGSHIAIKPPKEHHTSYINRKGFHSVLLQGVCDNTLLFTDVYIGEAGSIHDYTLFKRSDLYKQITASRVHFHNDSHMIGDLAYKLDTFLLVGYKNTGTLTPRQKNLNICLSKTRVVIENAFGLLKGRFRRLKLLETLRLDLISLLIIASSCILHNICILEGDTLDEMIDINAEREEENQNNPRNRSDIDMEAITRAATIKRNDIMNVLRMRYREEII